MYILSYIGLSMNRSISPCNETLLPQMFKSIDLMYTLRLLRIWPIIIAIVISLNDSTATTCRQCKEYTVRHRIYAVHIYYTYSTHSLTQEAIPVLSHSDSLRYYV